MKPLPDDPMPLKLRFFLDIVGQQIQEIALIQEPDGQFWRPIERDLWRHEVRFRDMRQRLRSPRLTVRIMEEING